MSPSSTPRVKGDPTAPLQRKCLRLLLLFFSLTLAVAQGADVAPRMLLLDGVRAPGNRIVVVGERGTILQSANSGQTWQPAVSGTTTTLTGVTFAPDSPQGWAVGHDALILATTDGGATWIKQYQGESLQDSFLDVLALDAQRVLAVGAYGLFLATSDGGKTWSRHKVIDEDAHLNRLSRSPSGTLYLAGEQGTLLRSTDQGTTWTKIPAPYDGSFYGVLALDRHTLLAHGLRGRVFRSADDGTSWSPVTTPQAVLLATSVQLKSNSIVLAGHPRVVLVSRDSGQTFSSLDIPLTTAVAELLELPDGRLLALGEAGATLLPSPK
jgi:photosystem II stability/assembly factor-like uncharacterized protein